MRPAFLALLCASTFAPAFAQTKTPAPAAPAVSIDKTKIEAYLRHLEMWIADVKVTIDDPKPAAEMPGYNNLMVHLSYKQSALDLPYFISQDGKHIFKGDSYNLDKSPFQANLDKMKLDGAPVFGTPGAPVTLVVFGDFQCPFCKEEANIIRNNVQSTFPGKTRVYFKDFPLESLHPWAKSAALTGKCVYRQNADAFWKFHDWVYEKQQEITLDNLSAKANEWAGANGIDAIQLGKCVDTKATDADVTKSQVEGRSMGVDSTPTLFLNGRKVSDNMTQWQVLQQLISMELDHQTKLAESGEKCCTVAPPTLGGK